MSSSNISSLVATRLAFSLHEVGVLTVKCTRQIWYEVASGRLHLRVVGERLRRVTRPDLITWARATGMVALAEALEAPIVSGPLLGVYLGAAGTEAALGISAPMVRRLTRLSGLPMVHSHQGTRPRASVATVVAWLSSRPIYVPQPGSAGGRGRTLADVPTRPAEMAEVVAQEPVTATNTAAEVVVG